MNDHLTYEIFVHQFPGLILTAREWPRKALPLHVLLLSAALGFDPRRSYSEAEVNAVLQRWILEFGRGFGIDHGSLRRHLIDEGYLQRDPSGSTYTVDEDGGRYRFDTSLHGLDLHALVETARQARAARKRAHTKP
jgi:hypothetical protein